MTHDDLVWFSILAAGVLIILVVESYALATGKKTLSRFIYDIAIGWPVMPFAIGMLCGHFFWPLAQ
jgi:hypothetical protein